MLIFLKLNLLLMKKGEKFSRSFLRERFEEQRSRLSLIDSTFLSLTQNLKSIHKAYVSKELTPPILYSETVFAQFKDRIATLRLKLDEIDADERDYGYLAGKHQAISHSISNLMETLSGFQHLQDQRISGLCTLKTIDYLPVLQSEYSSIGKVYNAFDALSYELTESCFGKEWMREKQYVPLSLFDQEYAVKSLSENGEGPLCLITVPYYDCFRSRFWPGLAHEVAHALVHSNEPLLGCIRSELGPLTDAFIFEFNNKDDADRAHRLYIWPQLEELVSDNSRCVCMWPSISFFKF